MKFKFHIGCSGFAQGYWKVVFYPEDLPSKDYLSYYSKHLKTVEINSTFYRRPTLKTLEKWHDSTTKSFQFFIKIPKTITHNKRLLETKEDTDSFCLHISGGLKEKLAGFLFQFPASFKFSAENLERVLSTINKDFVNVVEFRHDSWWTEEVLQTLKKNNIVFSGVSYPKGVADDVIINNDKLLYYRLHGIPILFKSEYSEIELKSLARKIKNFKGTAFVFFNNTWGTAGIKNALALQELLNDD